jgi:hypothetical protein
MATTPADMFQVDQDGSERLQCVLFLYRDHSFVLDQ